MWPTATAVTRPNEGNVRMYRRLIEEGKLTEEEATQMLGKSPWEKQGKLPEMWPTPTARDWKSGKASPETHARNSRPLSEVVEKFATPQARDYRTGQAKRWENPERSRNLNDQVATPEAGGQLNPRWVEWLMGYPLNYTYLED